MVSKFTCTNFCILKPDVNENVLDKKNSHTMPTTGTRFIYVILDKVEEILDRFILPRDVRNITRIYEKIST